MLAEDDEPAVDPAARRAGINFFDTANVYSDGIQRGDRRPGAARVHRPRRGGDRDQGPRPDAARTQWRAGCRARRSSTEIDASLRRLGMDYVDLYQIHRWDPHTPIEETLEALHDVVKAGKARYIGASSMYAWQFSKALLPGRAARLDRFVTMQNHYNLLYREEEREMFPLCARPGHRRDPVEPAGARPADPRLGRDHQPDRDRRVRQEALSARPSDREIVERVAEIADAARGAAGAGRLGLGAAQPGGLRADRRRQQAVAPRRRGRRPRA